MPRALKPMLMLACITGVVFATEASAQDRYGPSLATDFAAPGAARPVPPATPLRARFLSWPGKSVARSAVAAAVSAPTAQAALQGRFGPAPIPAGQSLTAYRAAPISSDGVWRPVPLRDPDAARPSTLAGTPQPTYAPAPNSAAPVPSYRLRTAAQPSATPNRWGVASADTGAPGADHVRFYSLHRQYGLQPDPPPIPPQFFAATADMSEPAGPIPAQRLTSTSSGASTTRTVRATDTSDGTAQP